VEKRSYRIMTVNPGSTSTKASIFVDDEEVWSTNVVHDPGELRAIDEMADQAPLRRDAVLAQMAADGVEAGALDAVVGVGGVGLAGVEYGTYAVNDVMLSDAATGKYATHPNNLGVIIANELAQSCGGQAMAAGMASAEEFQEVAHVGGFKDTPRRCCVHMLNTKEVCLRHAASLGKRYDQMNLIVAHVGGGITVAAHRQGKVVDGTDGVDLEGPMTPNRPGTVKLISYLNLCFAEGMTKQEMKKRTMTHGGLTDHLGTADVLEVKRMIEAGDEYAALVYDAMLYQVGKWLTMMAGVLEGNVDNVILTGGILKDGYAVDYISRMVGWIAPVAVYPGELEQEALAAAALRVLRGEEELREYTGIPVWDGFDHLKRA